MDNGSTEEEDGNIVTSIPVPSQSVSPSEMTPTTRPFITLNGVHLQETPPPVRKDDKAASSESEQNTTLNRRRRGRNMCRDNTGHLAPLRVQFVQSIRRKDVSGVAASLQENPGKNLHRLEDHYGVSAIEHAVISQCWEIVERLVDKTSNTIERAQAIERAMLFSIRENNIDFVDKLINLHRDMGMCRSIGEHTPSPTRVDDSLTLNNNGGTLTNIKLTDKHTTQDQDDWEDAEYSADINPMVLAAQLERVEIIEMLYERCCPRLHPLTANRNECLYPESCYICHVKIQYIGLQNIEECRAAVQVYRALSSPAYMFHAGVEDPILEAFVISDFLEKRKDFDPAYQEEYGRIGSRCSKFATTLLGLCRSAEEVNTLLCEVKGVDKTHRTQFHDVRFPRLLLAIKYHQKEFVSHPNTQLVMQNVWYSGLPHWVCRSQYHHLRLTLYAITMLIMFPITMVLYIFRIPFVEQFVKPPVNKFILDLCSFIYFLIMIFAKASNNVRPGRGEALGALDVFLFIWVIGLTIKYIVMSSRRKGIWWSYNNAENTDWRFHELLSLVFFWIYYVIMIVLWASTLVQQKPVLDRRRLDTMDPYLIAEASFAVASILTVIQAYSFFKMSSVLGPLQVSLKKMVFDVAKFLVLFMVVLSAFAVGLSYLYHGYSGFSSMNVQTNQTEEQEDHFDGLNRAYKTLFWNIFGYGEVEYANMVVQGFIRNETEGIVEVKSHRFNELLGYAIYGVYHITVVVVLLNMLIAMMANSYNNIAANADMEWKYARTRLIMNYVDEVGVLCAPFNMLPLRRLLALFGKKFKCCAIFKKTENKKTTRNSRKLMEKLQKRFWKVKKQRKVNKRYTGIFTGITNDECDDPVMGTTAYLTPVGEQSTKPDFKQKISGSTNSSTGI